MSHTIARALPFWDFFYLFVLSRAGTGKMENRYTSFNLLPHVRKSLVDFPLSPHKKSKSARKKSLQKKKNEEEEAARDAESAKADISHSALQRNILLIYFGHKVKNFVK